MVDIVCPLGRDSRWKNNELKFSLRSLERFGTNFRNVVIVGERAPFLNDSIIHIPTKEVEAHGHERRIYEKIMAACKDDRVSDDFLFWNDDYFLTAHIDCSNYPFYYHGSIKEKADRRMQHDGYRMSMQNCNTILDRLGVKEKRFFDIHCPIIYNKKKFIETVGAQDWTVSNGMVIKSLYGNAVGVSPVKEMTDMKIHRYYQNFQLKEMIKGRHIFSISDHGVTADFERFCHELYKNKSRWEK